MRIAVFAIGRIGPTLAVQHASMGQDVVGINIDLASGECVNQKVDPFPREASLGEELVGNLTGQRVVVLGTSYRDGVKETAVARVCSQRLRNSLVKGRS